MSVLDRIKGLFGVSFGVPGASTYQSAQDWVLGLPVDTYGSLVEPYSQSAAICTAVSTIAADAAGVEWEFYSEADDETEIEDHPLEDFWYQPDPYMHGSQLWVGTYVSLKLWGEAFWYYPGLKIGASDGLRVSRRSTGQLDLLDPRAVTVEFAKDGTTQWTVR